MIMRIMIIMIITMIMIIVMIMIIMVVIMIYQQMTPRENSSARGPRSPGALGAGRPAPRDGRLK